MFHTISPITSQTWVQGFFDLRSKESSFYFQKKNVVGNELKIPKKLVKMRKDASKVPKRGRE